MVKQIKRIVQEVMNIQSKTHIDMGLSVFAVCVINFRI